MCAKPWLSELKASCCPDPREIESYCTLLIDCMLPIDNCPYIMFLPFFFGERTVENEKTL
jgi:hypothetical protein